MTRPIIKTHNVETNEVSEKEMTAAQFAEHKAIKEQAQTEAETKASTRQAILDRLGLTAEEAALLLG